MLPGAPVAREDTYCLWGDYQAPALPPTGCGLCKAGGVLCSCPYWPAHSAAEAHAQHDSGVDWGCSGWGARYSGRQPRACRSNLAPPLGPQTRGLANLFRWWQRQSRPLQMQRPFLRNYGVSVRAPLVSHTSQAVRLKLIGHFLTFWTIFICYIMDQFYPGAFITSQQDGVGEKSKDFTRIKHRTFYIELVFPIDFFFSLFFHGLGKVTSFP